MEEKEMKRKNPNRDFILSQGLNFLGNLKFHNPGLDQMNKEGADIQTLEDRQILEKG